METVKVGKKELPLELVRRGSTSWSVLCGNKVLGHIWQRKPERLNEERFSFGLSAVGEWAGSTASRPRAYNVGPRASILRWLAARAI